MRTDQPVTVRRLDYTPPDHLVDTIDLRFELDPQRTVVVATLAVRRREGAPAAAPLRLDGEALELLSAEIDGAPVPPSRLHATSDGLTIDAPPAAFVLVTRVAIAPASNTELMGLYVSNGNFFTQCEAQGFRRITYFPDRPDVMARYTVELVADRARWPVLLSNGNLVESDALPDGRHRATWVDPFPKPSYLFALVAGNLVAQEERISTRSGRDALLQVWVEPGNLDRTDHAMRSLVRSIRWDERRFGLELDLDRFMIVAVADFNMGAMENKGLNVFNTKYVFAHPRIATDTDFANVESVVAHEYFHNWTGNRVTCRDWFQLTLKEGLTVFRDQEFSADTMAESAPDEAGARSARAVKRIDDVRALRSLQFAEDAGPMAHPIRPDAYQAIDNFYTVTVYEKGAEVIRMLQTLVGRDGFAEGMALYFARHDGQAVTCEDFVAAIADANGRDLRQFRRWYAQAGTPRVRAEGGWDAGSKRYELVLSQWCPPSPGQPEKAPFHIPVAVGLIGSDGRELAAATLELTDERQVFTFDGVDPGPAADGRRFVVPSLLRDFSAPVVLEHAADDEALAFLLAHDTDAFNRWEASQRLAVSAILRALRGEPVDRAAAAFVGALGRPLADDTLDPALRDQLLGLPSEGFVAEQLQVVDPVALRAARNSVRNAVARGLASTLHAIRDALRPSGPYSPDAASAGRRALRNSALALLVEAGVDGADALAAAQIAEADNMTDRLAALGALVQSASPRREAALADYARAFADEPLAMDKWFVLQATMHRQPGEAPVIERVRALTAHPAFSMRNPNKIRSLVTAFCTGNLAEFHAADCSGYAFWTEQVLALDGLNPQIASRLARAMDRWRKFEPARQAAMRAALERVASQARSPDVREIVGKALA
ncbi:MAG: aminopeptidase N [Burkholderiaceae bacterium]|nr:aminopeptidase N [Burkholderiales bacterium]MCZ8101782.1 aminopeptidase N [Burkholderiales bacterium]MCZ8340974.1 aminopeptidase N [Burkholderiaceae bacterium]